MSQTPALSATAESTAPPLSIRLFFLSSWLLGGLLTADGLYQRLTGGFLPAEALMPWIPLVRGLGLQPVDLGWPLLVAGLSLVGASFGVYLRRRWGVLTGLLVSGLAVFYPYPGTLLALACLALLLSPPTRAYLQRPPNLEG